MENFRLWEQYVANYRDMMCQLMDQTIKQSETFYKQLDENVEQVFNAWHVPAWYNGGENRGDESAQSGQAQVDENTPKVCRPEPVWTYRGYQLEGGNFTNAMVHFFRAESYRADIWRRRLDTTTNWAVITTGATLSLAWDPRVIILSTLLITLFLFIEARRYRYYELWSYRVRLMETDFFAAMLVPPFRPAPDWAESLADNLLRPKFPISMLEAFGRRFRRNYIWIYTILWLAWLFNVWLHPTPVTTWTEFMTRATIGTIPAWIVLLVGILFNGTLFITGLLTRRLRQAAGEVLPPAEDFPLPDPPTGAAEERQQRIDWRAWFRPSRHREQILAHIITDCPRDVADGILREMGRGVTSLSGKGMYTDQAHTVLMCALTTTEVARLKAVVSKLDPRAFVIASPAHEVFGAGFSPLQS